MKKQECKHDMEQLEQFAKKCSEVNTQLWDVIGECEELLSHPVVKKINGCFGEDREVLLKELKQRFLEVAQDTEVISICLHESTIKDAVALLLQITGSDFS